MRRFPRRAAPDAPWNVDEVPRMSHRPMGKRATSRFGSLSRALIRRLVRRRQYAPPMTMVWQEARSQASALQKEFGTNDPYEICARLGIDVIETLLPAGVSGMIVKERGQDAQVFIERGDVRGRRRFTCAHELGHFIERMNVADDDDFSFRDRRGNDYDLHEFFADEFAGELTMPAEAVSRLRDQGVPATTMAARFGVTLSAVERRLRRLRKDSPKS